jgi:ABC-type branched-subunit amino acid transport system substrate-binding protein
MKNHRSFRGRTAVAAAGSLVLMAAALAGCSSSDGDSAAEDTAAEETTSEETPAEDTAAEEGEAQEEAAPEDSCNLLTLLGVDAADPLNGQTLKLGAVLPLSGGGEKAYGESMTKGIDLALEDIAASGGPNIELDVKDNGTANPELSVTAINELGE